MVRLYTSFPRHKLDGCVYHSVLCVLCRIHLSVPGRLSPPSEQLPLSYNPPPVLPALLAGAALLYTAGSAGEAGQRVESRYGRRGGARGGAQGEGLLRVRVVTVRSRRSAAARARRLLRAHCGTVQGW